MFGVAGCGWPRGGASHVGQHSPEGTDGDPCRGHQFGCREAMARGHVAVMKCANCAFREDISVRSE